jgi:hypothetical protein
MWNPFTAIQNAFHAIKTVIVVLGVIGIIIICIFGCRTFRKLIPTARNPDLIEVVNGKSTRRTQRETYV